MCVGQERDMAQLAKFSKTRAGLMASLTAALLLGGCAQSSESLTSSLLDPTDKPPVATETAEAKLPQTELEKATKYWGDKFKTNTKDVEAAVNYAKNLKAMGEKGQALAVLQQAAFFHADNRLLASEYGRLALELDQISVAKQMLAVADDPAAPDWRVISARGTVLAKEGKYRDSIPLYERALTLSADQPSVMNNLAMSYAMAGEANKAEEIMRKIEAKDGSPKTRQNLALVLGLQGKFDEAKQISTQDLGAEGAAANTDLLKRMVKPASGSGKTRTAKATPSVEPNPLPVVNTSAETVFGSEPISAAAPQSTGSPPLKGMTR
jgi:Flp pilus assembly protein TadD